MSEDNTPEFDYPVEQRAFYDETEDKLHIRSRQNTAPILEINKIERNEFDAKFNSDIKHPTGWQRVASIPNIVVDELMRSGRWGDRKAMRKWLNDPENKMFRTTNTKL